MRREGEGWGFYKGGDPGRPPIGRQAQCVIFFFKFATKSLEKKKQALSPVGGATGACRPPLGREARWGGNRPPLFFLGLLFLQGPILSYSSVYSSSSSARSRPLTPTARNLSFIKSRKKIARTSLISRALWNPQT